MFETLRQLISVGGHRLDDVLLRIDTMYASGRLDGEERAQLIDLAQTNADQDALLPSSPVAVAVRRSFWGLAA